MIGIDLVDIRRFKNKSAKFLARYMNQNELLEYQKIANSDLQATYAAELWAIKEAIFKANNSLSDFSHLEIKKTNGVFSHEAFEISLSHEKNMLVAVAIKK